VAPSLATAIPSPTVGVLHLGPLPLRGYAVAILLGIAVAIWITGRRLADRGGQPGQALDISAYAVVAGIVGGRLYHVVTTPGPYFGEGGDPWRALAVWEGGLGIWGAISLGALGAWFGCRRAGVRFLDFADAAAPGVAVAQAIGRWGNWFNNELYGRATDLPWGLTIHQWDASAGRAVTDASGAPVVLGTLALVLVDRRRRLARGQLFGLYVAGYPLGRVVIELMRSDAAVQVLGLRINVWTSLVVFLLGVWIVVHCGRRERRERAPADDAPVSAP
jgi:prolipoprotein diacylglyceryl transferase